MIIQFDTNTYGSDYAKAYEAGRMLITEQAV
jgi:hypothetical protein